MTEKKRFFVIEEAECTECQGSGWVMHPVWERYRHEHPGCSTPDETWFNEDEAWFHERGFYCFPPDVEIMCCECEGGGTVRREVDLVDALGYLERNNE